MSLIPSQKHLPVNNITLWGLPLSTSDPLPPLVRVCTTWKDPCLYYLERPLFVDVQILPEYPPPYNNMLFFTILIYLICFITASKEAAFANAIASAGVVLSIARGCRDGQLNSCGCSSAGRPSDLKGEWMWGGCGDNIHYGYK